MPGAKPAMRAAAAELGTDPDARARPSDFAQALFDLGATICTPTRPACGLCPWQAGCAAHRQGIAEALPRRAPKRVRPVRHGVHYWLQDAQGQVLLRRRPPSGLYGGMTELPGPTWRDTPYQAAELHRSAPMPAAWLAAGEVRHGLTHFELHLQVLAARVPHIAAEGFLCPEAELADQALPSLMRKCVVLARGALAG